MSTEKQGKTFTGIVISDKMDKSITVKVERREPHPIYQKVVTKTTKLHAHDPEGKAKVGDKVLILESKPISKTKSFVLVQILEKAS